jgi:hypothetical protein
VWADAVGGLLFAIATAIRPHEGEHCHLFVSFLKVRLPSSMTGVSPV